ncbi:MAG: phosphoribosyltransferase family protein [Thermomicrobiales bacterium]
MAGAEDNRPAQGAMPAPGDTVTHTSWRALPLPFRPRITLGCPRFAHPFEAEFARLLDYYRTPWSYEPTTFALDWDARGRPIEFCTPDFYLPKQRLYIELTTVRQCLVTRKHRKVRILRARYPGVDIRLLYRRDYERLLLSDDAGGDSDPAERAGRVLFAAETVEQRVAELAIEIATGGGTSAGAATPLLLGAGPGANTFLAALTVALDRADVLHEVDTMALVPFRRLAAPAGGRVVICRRPVTDVTRRRVVLVDGVVSTGLSLAYLTRWLVRQGASVVEVCALLNRQAARVADVPVTYSGFEAPHEVVVGYGLSRRRQFRDLPFIARLERET